MRHAGSSANRALLGSTRCFDDPFVRYTPLLALPHARIEVVVIRRASWRGLRPRFQGEKKKKKREKNRRDQTIARHLQALRQLRMYGA
jgi:hypothetical protein